MRTCITLLVAGLLSTSLAGAHGKGSSHAKFTLTILHNNDGESQLIDAGTGLEDFGGVARFKTLLDRIRFQEMRQGHAVITVSSGDNFLAGPEFTAGLERERGRLYDAVALDAFDYDALSVGNHDFDFGPDLTARFISEFVFSRPVFVSANLDVSGEGALRALERKGRIAPSTVVVRNGEKIGIIGAITPKLPFISSPRNAKVDPDVAGAVQGEIDRLTKHGVKIIVLISHLQSVLEDLALIGELRGLDAAIAGGGDDLLANDDDLLIPGDVSVGPYPTLAKDADGKEVPVATTSGAYRYLGQLTLEFDRKGNVIGVSEESGPKRVSGIEPDAVRPNLLLQHFVVDPVAEFTAQLATTVIGSSEVELDGRRSSVRTTECNEGNLVADALRWQANELAGSFGAPGADVALQNGGGIRNDAIVPAGDITQLTTFDIVPFANYVCIVPSIPAAQFKDILENAVSRVEFTDGRFAQISGFSMVYDPAGQAQVLDADGNVTTRGTRVVSATLDDGTVLVQNGSVVPGAPAVNIATIDFLARSGDQYPYRGATFTSVGVSYQQALANYITGALGGQITATDYPEGGEGRISTSGLSKHGQTENTTAEHTPSSFELRQNYPNPFNPTTTISYDLPQESAVMLTVYNLLGEKVSELFDGRQAAGTYRFTFDAAGLASGIYFARLQAGSFQQVRAMLLAR